MNINKISAITSTNTYLKELLRNDQSLNELAVVAEKQTQGRGQMGTEWHSQEGKSLMMSALKRLERFHVENRFYLSMLVSIAIKNVLSFYNLPDIKIKWPNDILSANKKVCGLLLEPVLKKDQIKAIIIGVGLNLNETEMPDLPQAASIKMLTGKHVDIDTFALEIVNEINEQFLKLNSQAYSVIKREYLNCLYRKGVLSVFKDPAGNEFNGLITGVSNSGKLQVATELGEKEFDLKEIKLLNGL